MPRLGDCVFLTTTDAAEKKTVRHALVTAVWGTSDLINCVAVLEVGAARWRKDNVLLGKIDSFNRVPHQATPEAGQPGGPTWREHRFLSLEHQMEKAVGR